MVSASRSPAWFTSDADPDAPPAVIQLIAAGDLAVIELGDGQVRTRLGRAADPDLVLDGPPRAVLGAVIRGAAGSDPLVTGARLVGRCEAPRAI